MVSIIATVFVVITVAAGLYAIFKYHLVDRIFNLGESAAKGAGNNLVDWLSPSKRRERKKEKLSQEIEIKKLEEQKGKGRLGRLVDYISQSNKQYTDEIKGIERNLPPRTVTDPEGRVKPNPDFIRAQSKLSVLKTVVQANDVTTQIVARKEKQTQTIVSSASQASIVIDNLNGPVNKEALKLLFKSTLDRSKLYQGLETEQREITEEEIVKSLTEIDQATLILSKYKEEDLKESEDEYEKIFSQLEEGKKELSRVLQQKRSLANQTQSNLPQAEVVRFNQAIDSAGQNLLELTEQMEQQVLFFAGKIDVEKKAIDSCISLISQEKATLNGDKSKRDLQVQSVSQLRLIEKMITSKDEADAKRPELQRIITSFETLCEEINKLELAANAQQEKNIIELIARNISRR